MGLLSGCLGLLLMVSYSVAYSSGPPVNNEGVCASMTPSATKHGATPQTSEAPYEVTFEGICYKDGHALQVTVKNKGAASNPILGMFVQGRSDSDTTAVGTFTVSHADLQTLYCGSDHTAVGHNKQLSGNSYTMMWTPPAGYKATVNFRATVVEQKQTFWIAIKSPNVLLCPSDANASTPHIINGLILGLSLIVGAIVFLK